MQQKTDYQIAQRLFTKLENYHNANYSFDLYYNKVNMKSIQND